MRLACIVEYDGSGYCGWQRQTNGRTVQEVLEAALSFVADHPVSVVAAGRTDAGVHACAQVVHWEAHHPRPRSAWLLGTNSRLPPDVALRWCDAVAEDFHARFSALSRSYRYLILNRPLRSGLWRRHCAWECRPLDAERMHAAAQHLLGEHDFNAFRAADCQAHSSVRRVSAIRVTREGDLIAIDVSANGFLHNMVRIIAGTLLRVGRGQQSPAWVAEVLRARRRCLSGTTAPAHGLYLTAVEYPPRFAIPVPELQAAPGARRLPRDGALFLLP